MSIFYTNLFVVSLDWRIKLSDWFEGLGQAKSNSRCHNRTLVTRAFRRKLFDTSDVYMMQKLVSNSCFALVNLHSYLQCTYLLIYKFGSWYVFPKVIFRQRFTYLFTHNSQLSCIFTWLLTYLVIYLLRIYRLTNLSHDMHFEWNVLTDLTFVCCKENKKARSTFLLIICKLVSYLHMTHSSLDKK